MGEAAERYDCETLVTASGSTLSLDSYEAMPRCQGSCRSSSPAVMPGWSCSERRRAK